MYLTPAITTDLPYEGKEVGIAVGGAAIGSSSNSEVGLVTLGGMISAEEAVLEVVLEAVLEVVLEALLEALLEGVLKAEIEDEDRYDFECRSASDCDDDDDVAAASSEGSEESSDGRKVDCTASVKASIGFSNSFKKSCGVI